MTFLKHLPLVGFILSITVIGCRAQVQVNVTFNPPSPVSQGNTTFRCEFTLPAGTVLAQQYWQIVNGARFFEYVPGNNATIHEDYRDKILDFSTDNDTYVNIVFNVTACDVEQYLCNILADSSADNNDQKSLEVENMIPPVLMYGGNEVSENERVYLPFGRTISCVLENAGPPLPEYLELETNYTSFSPRNDSSPAQNNITCVWSYLNPVELFVHASNLTEPVWFRCRVDYTGSSPQYSPVLIITQEIPFTTDDATASTKEPFTDYNSTEITTMDSNSTETTTMETTPDFTDTSETITSFTDTSISETTFSLNSSTMTDEETTTMMLSTEATTGTETEEVTTAAAATTTTTMSDSTFTTEKLTSTSSQNKSSTASILKPFSKYALILTCTLIFGSSQ